MNGQNYADGIDNKALSGAIFGEGYGAKQNDLIGVQALGDVGAIGKEKVGLADLVELDDVKKDEGPLDLAGLHNRRVGYASKGLGIEPTYNW